jgi:hypothetical protein
MKEIDTGIFTVNNNDIYIIGDIHGDYQCLIHCLVDLCKVCDITKIYNDVEFKTKNRENLEWKENNNSVVVLCGDLVDRKRFDHILDDECSDVFILKTLLRLKKDAIKNNGDVIIISGNHEIMNIISSEENIYISPANKEYNNKYFKNLNFLNDYISNSYAWVKINDILIAHGGLCSDYLNFLNNKIVNNKINNKPIISYVNNKYRKFFINPDNYRNITNNEDIKKKNETSYNLFVRYDLTHKTKHNVFWCREWGYGKIDCDKFKSILEQVNCKKMIISHCPQFLSSDIPKMINFECILENSKKNNDFLLARIDLGMSRSFDYNKEDKFLHYLNNNYNRKICILKLLNDKIDPNNLYFNNTAIITNKLSCIQYLLLKYGLTIDEWKKKNIESNWLGFKYINDLLNSIKNKDDNYNIKCSNITQNSNNILLCLLYQIYMKNIRLTSIDQFNKYI